MDFDEANLPGWHVVIGDNGAGKTTFIRATALAIMGPENAKMLKLSSQKWLNKDSNSGSVKLSFISFEEKNNKAEEAEIYYSRIRSLSGRRAHLEPQKSGFIILGEKPGFRGLQPLDEDSYWKKSNNWFSASFGPFRRFEKNDGDWNDSFDVNPLFAAHRSSFDDNMDYGAPLDWLQGFHYRSLDKNVEPKKRKQAQSFLKIFEIFLNQDGLLPKQTMLKKIGSEGVFFVDGRGNEISLDQLSDGYKSVLSLIFTLIWQMILMADEEMIFLKLDNGTIIIDTPGLVLIDEIDAHLHPTWQTKIGEALTKFFPKIQFIVTTHSPLICRAAEHGSVWRLAAPGSGRVSGRITGTDLQRLIYGNVLDAYGTEVFGENVTSSSHAAELRDKLASLNKKSYKGTITKKEKKELDKLRNILPT